MIETTKHHKLYFIRSKETHDTLGIIAAEYETQKLGDNEDRAPYFECWAVWKENGFEDGAAFYPVFKAHVRWDAETRLNFAKETTPNFYMVDGFVAYLTVQHYLDFVARDILSKDYIYESYDEEFKLWDSFQEVLSRHTQVNEFLDKDIKSAKLSFEDVVNIFKEHASVETDD